LFFREISYIMGVMMNTLTHINFHMMNTLTHINFQMFVFSEFMTRRGMNPVECDLNRILLTIRDVVVPSIIEGPWVAGGSLVQTLTGQPVVGDVDIYFRTEVQYVGALARAEKEFGDPISVSVSSTTFETNNGDKISLITRKFYETPEAILKDFDLTICQFALAGDTLYCGPYSQVDLAMRLLKTTDTGTTHPHTTALRMLKYVGRGFRIMPGDIEKVTKEALDLFAASELLKHNLDKANPDAEVYYGYSS
jgi:hypothetical protein